MGNLFDFHPPFGLAGYLAIAISDAQHHFVPGHLQNPFLCLPVYDFTGPLARQKWQR